MAVRSNAWVCGRSLAESAGSNPTGSMDVCCEVEGCESLTECGVSEGV